MSFANIKIHDCEWVLHKKLENLWDITRDKMNDNAYAVGVKQKIILVTTLMSSLKYF